MSYWDGRCEYPVEVECSECEGTGAGPIYASGGGVHYVSRDMAIDAGEPAMEGTAIEEPPTMIPTKCERCGGTGKLEVECQGTMQGWGSVWECDSCGREVGPDDA